MEIRNLKNTSLSEIVACLIKSFDGYFVSLPSEVDFWRKKFHGARVNFELSFGVFDTEKLVAFIINGVYLDNGLKTAFNSGTGVLPEYRGQRLVDKMYDFAFPKLKENGIQKYKLEVIDINERAIKVYERIGFEKKRRLKSYKGNLPKSMGNIILKEIDFSEIKCKSEYPYSWDQCNEAVILSDSYKVYKIENSEEEIGHLICSLETGNIAQVEVYKHQWIGLFNALSKVTKTIKINNVDSRRVDLIQYLEELGIENSIDQFEMELLFKKGL